MNKNQQITGLIVLSAIVAAGYLMEVGKDWPIISEARKGFGA